MPGRSTGWRGQGPVQCRLNEDARVDVDADGAADVDVDEGWMPAWMQTLTSVAARIRWMGFWVANECVCPKSRY